MHIVYLSADFGVPFFGYKGASVHVRELVGALRRAGHEVSVFSPAIDMACVHADDGLYAVAPSEHYAHLVQELKAFDRFLGRKTRLQQEMRNILYNQTLYDAALPLLRSRQVDVIYERYALFGYAGIRLARELGVPHLLEVNAPLADEQESMRGLELQQLARDAERRIFCESDQVFVVSHALHEFVRACGASASRIQLLPNAVDPQRFVAADDGQAVRAQYGLHGKRVIGFVGSLKPWHGTETLFEAFYRAQSMVPSTHLLIVGDGPCRQDLEAYTQTHALEAVVTFTGNVPYEDIPQYIAAMDITVAPYIPSDNFYYSPLKMFEYMVMGKPVVAGRIGQVEEVLCHRETGMLFEPGDIAQLSAVLTELLRDRELCRRLGSQAKAWVQQERTWENNARQVITTAQRLRQEYGLVATTS